MGTVTVAATHHLRPMTFPAFSLAFQMIHNPLSYRAKHCRFALARILLGLRIWDGSHSFCLVPQQSYSLGTAELDCSGKGAIFRGFREIDTLGAEGFRVVIE